MTRVCVPRSAPRSRMGTGIASVTEWRMRAPGSARGAYRVAVALAERLADSVGRSLRDNDRPAYCSGAAAAPRRLGDDLETEQALADAEHDERLAREDRLREYAGAARSCRTVRGSHGERVRT